MKDVENVQSNLRLIAKYEPVITENQEQTPEEALEIATQAIEGGSDGIMIGGSTVNGEDVDNTCKILSENIAVPIIIFPGNTSSVSKYADAIFYMSYVNSRRSSYCSTISQSFRNGNIAYALYGSRSGRNSWLGWRC